MVTMMPGVVRTQRSDVSHRTSVITVVVFLDDDAGEAGGTGIQDRKRVGDAEHGDDDAQGSQDPTQ